MDSALVSMTPLLAVLENIGYISMVVLGVGFLIFFHELGHFLAAKASGVRVDAFSIGMGPRLFGWKRGDTDYKVSLLPIGGYVRMHGEAPGEGDPTDPRALNNASVGWRFLIFSGGVIMNLVFALIAFPLVFNSGVPFTAPLIGSVQPGSPAWEAGLERGDRILRVDGDPVYSFDQLAMESALAGDESILLEIQRGDAEFGIRVLPRFNPQLGLKTLGLGPALEDHPTVQLDPGDHPARSAGLKTGDRVLVDFGQALAPDERAELAWQQLLDPMSWQGRRREMRVERDGRRLDFVVDPITKLGDRPRLGIVILRSKVLGVRARGDRQVKNALTALGLRAGDVVTGIRVGPESIVVRHPQDIVRVLASEAADVRLEVLRAGPRAKERGAAATELLDVPGFFRGRAGARVLRNAIAWGGDDISCRVHAQPGLAAAAAGLASGDRILSIAGRDVRSWSDITRAVAEADGRPVRVRWQPWPTRPGETIPPPREAEIRPQRVARPYYGFEEQLSVKTEIYRVDGLFGSLRAGLVSSVNTLRQLYVTLKRIVGGSVSADNLGGIITISRATYSYASEGWQRFLWFLAILSLNLAFINVLPIPVLDGGQLMFLLIEKIKGSPVSVRVMTYAQILGIAMVLLLLIFVTFNDIRRLFQ